MPPDPGLAHTQRWMQDVILAEAPCEEAAAARMVLPSKTMRPVERLDVYRDMYEARLIEALEVDYPGLADFLGEQLFTELMGLYIRANPSRTYTLNTFGAKLPDFIPEVEGLPRAPFLQDMARLECARAEVFDAEETPSLTRQAIAAVPESEWENARLTPIAAFRLIRLRYPAHRYLQALHEDKPRPPARRKETHLAIYRRDYAVMSLELTKPSFQVLQSLASGSTLGAAIRTAKMHTPARHKQLFTMFQRWMSQGLFQSVSTARQ